MFALLNYCADNILNYSYLIQKNCINYTNKFLARKVRQTFDNLCFIFTLLLPVVELESEIIVILIYVVIFEYT